MEQAKFVVVGGGIAGVACAERLCLFAPESSVLLVTASPLIKRVTDVIPIGKTFYTFNVREAHADSLNAKYPRLRVVYDTVTRLVSSDRRIITDGGITIVYEFLCVCTGALPDLIPQCAESKMILGIRDTGSVKEYMSKVNNAKRLLVVGNGGIASEIVYATKGVDVVWAIKDNHISSTFVDPGAAEFFRSSENFKTRPAPESKGAIKRTVFSEENDGAPSKRGAALGPDWLKDLKTTGTAGSSSLEIIYNVRVEHVTERPSENLPLSVKLTNGKVVECDLVVSATGVTPRVDFASDVQFSKGPDGGLEVDEFMKTSVDRVYAAGDVCHAGWKPSWHWFQMRLWTQAHQTGCMAARSMYSDSVGEETYQDFCFEMFSHTTNLFGYPVILLGKFNGQGLGGRYEILIRSTPNLEYIKFVLVDDKLQGAILIGETDLEETCENLILNQIDLSPYGDDILNPDIDIEDYFD